MPNPKDLGTMLVDAGKISNEQLTQALALVEKGKGRLEQILIQIGAVSDEEDLTSFIGKQLNIGAIRLSDLELNPEIVKLIPNDIARKFNVIAVSKLGKTLVVAICDPNNIYVLDAIKFITGCTVQPVISPEGAIQKAIEHYYSNSSQYTEILKGLEDSELEVISAGPEEVNDMDLQSAVQDKPLVKLVDSGPTGSSRS